MELKNNFSDEIRKLDEIDKLLEGHRLLKLTQK